MPTQIFRKSSVVKFVYSVCRKFACTVCGNLVPKDALFEPEQLAEIYRALAFVREQDETLSFGRAASSV